MTESSVTSPLGPFGQEKFPYPTPGFEPDWFEDRIVTLTVHYENRRVYIKVDPDRATIVFDPLRLDRRRPRQVRWLVDGLKDDDLLLIRPKARSSSELFNPEGEGRFVVPGVYNTVCSGLPQNPVFNDGKAQWRYEVEVFRGTESLGSVDPEIEIERKYPTG